MAWFYLTSLINSYLNYILYLVCKEVDRMIMDIIYMYHLTGQNRTITQCHMA